MKKNRAMALILGCICFFLFTVSTVKAQDAESTVNQLKSELKQSNTIAQNEAKAINSSLKDMVEKGADKKVVTELSESDLINADETPKEAGNVVSQPAVQINQQGLKGKDSEVNIYEAIKQRKDLKEYKAKKMLDKVKEKEREVNRKVRQIEKKVGRARIKEKEAKKKAEEAEKKAEEVKKKAGEAKKKAEKVKKKAEDKEISRRGRKEFREFGEDMKKEEFLRRMKRKKEKADALKKEDK